jgi:hypothetical protein
VNGLYATFTASTLAAVEEIGPPISGLFLCAEPDETFLSSAVFELGSDPVETPSDPATIVCVFVAVESFEQEHPLISAEVNGFSGR